jgi:anti-sigma factor RsiW
MTRTVSDAERVDLNALVDGELDAAATAALEQRIAADPVLGAARDSIAASHEAVGGLGRPAPPDDFLRRIEGLAAGGAAAAKPSRWFASGWQSIAAAIVISAFVASSATYLLVAPRTSSLDELIASGHRRSLLAASPVDVLSSDRHTVKPWLDARLGVSPPAPDLAAQGYPLVGGRVDVLGQQPVPVLVYRHNEHTITLVAVPSSAASSPPVDLASGGFNMVRWRAVGFEFRAVSDLETDELNAFVRGYEVATASNGS